jgi:isoleucyl-tRNA synthetase
VKPARCIRAPPSWSKPSRSASKRPASKPGSRSTPAELLGAEAAQYRKMSDTLDVWFDSGSTHSSVLRGSHRNELAYPADLYLEGSDQHRGWFQSSLLIGCALDGRAPYKALLTHGFVVDGKGLKMSKSKGNVIAPQKIADTLGADILRLWVAATDYSGELSISDEILKRVVEATAASATRCASCSPTPPTSTRRATCRRSKTGWRSTATHWP